MRRLGPRREHVRIDDAEVIRFLDRWAHGGCGDWSLFPNGYFDFVKRLRQLCEVFGIPTVDGVGMTPASLRAGGATFWYVLKDSTEFVRYRGRWANSRMLEIYIQEAAACNFLASLPLEVQAKISRVGRLTPYLLLRAS